MTDEVPEILVVDDERSIRDGLKAVLTAEGFSARTARDGEDALAKFSERRPDLVLLDVMMPKMNGFAVCEAIRAQDRVVPVVFLTAKDSDADQVRAFGLGADDYIAKGAPEQLLVVRVRRALERVRQMAQSCAADSRVVRVGEAEADMASFAVKLADGTVSRLTKTEADILRILDENRSRYVASGDLIAALRGEGFVCEDTMLYVHVSNLRRKLGADGKRVFSVRGVGYSLA